MPQLAFVLLGRTEPVQADGLGAALSRRLGLATQVEADSKGEGDILSADLGDKRSLFVAFVPAPVPEGEAEQFVPYSLYAMGSGWQLPEYPAHAMVTLVGDDESVTVESLELFTKAIAAVLESSHAVGVYWAATGATHNSDFFLEVANVEGMQPIMLWNGLSLARGEDGRVSLLSLGMSQLGLPNLMLSAPEGQGNAAVEVVFDLLGYLIQRGEPIPDGDTIGFSAEQKLPIRYETSPINPEEQVWCVDLP